MSIERRYALLKHTHTMAEIDDLDLSLYLRKDISQTITGTYVYQGSAGAFEFEGLSPRLYLDETDQVADERLWAVRANGKVLDFASFNDAKTVAVSALRIVRGTGNTISQVEMLTNVEATGYYRISMDNNAPVRLNRPSGGTAQYTGVEYYDNSTLRGGLYWDHTNNFFAHRVSGTNRLTISSFSVDLGTDVEFRYGTIGSVQTGAQIQGRGKADSIEWGHTNSAGYANTIGFSSSSGRGHLAFNAEVGTTINTFRTRGIVGRVLQADLTGGLVFGRVTTASADNQTLTADLTLTSLGRLEQSSNGSHFTMFDTDGTDPTDRGLLEFNQGATALWGRDESAATWRRFISGNATTGELLLSESLYNTNVLGTFEVDSTSTFNNDMTLTRAAGATFTITNSAAVVTTVLSAGTSAGFVGTNTSHDLNVRTNGSTRMVVTAAGAVSVTNSLTVAGTAVVLATRTLTSGNGLTGGGDLSADRTLAVGAGIGIIANADDVAVDRASTTTTTAVGYLDMPQNTQDTNYTLVLTDRAKVINHTSGTAHAWTIPPNSSVAFPSGTVISMVNGNGGGNITITQGAGVTLRWAGTASTGNRTLAANGIATITKTATDTWYVTGNVT